MTATFTRGFRRTPRITGPYPAGVDEIAGLNAVFSSAFTDRYRRDGMVGVHVPNLSPAVWRFALEDAGIGAMLWRGERDEPVAFNLAHHSGTEGWMGPLAVLPAYQGHGVGKEIVRAGIALLRAERASVIGLETMPRTVDNIGFYSRLGFVPGHLTFTMTLDGAYADAPRVPQLGRLASSDREAMITACAALTDELLPGYDFTREIALTHSMSLGDTLAVPGASGLDGFALCHTTPLVEGRARDELRVLKLVARDVPVFDLLIAQLADLARRAGTRRLALRLQGAYPDLYQRLITRGAHVRWTDLRMTVAGAPEPRPATGIVLSNWEI